MTDRVTYTGMVIKCSDVKEFDKRLVILTREMGKIVVFARGAKRPKSALVPASRIFAYGEFELYPGKDAFSLNKVYINEMFENLTKDITAVCYGSYFLEMVDYFTQDGVRADNILKLLYITLKALENDNIPNELIRYIFELKMLVFSGEYPETFQCIKCQKENVMYFSAAAGGCLCKEHQKQYGDNISLSASTLYTMQYIITSKLEKLYTFLVKPEVLNELRFVMKRYMSLHVDKEFKSLEILNALLK